MTTPAYLAMPDAVNVNLLPAGYPAYLGYVDGRVLTRKVLSGMFPDAHLIGLTVNGMTIMADGCDIEAGDLTPATGAAWAARKLKGEPNSRPVIYASISNMPAVLGQLALSGVQRSQVRLLSAHYGRGPHICGPATCPEGAKLGAAVDGTQWTDTYLVEGGNVDMSILSPGFFQTPPNSTETERIVQELGTVKQGDTGEAVRTVQGLCNARDVLTKVDGVFGPNTASAVAWVQHQHGLTEDSIVGPLTWPVLLGIA